MKSKLVNIIEMQYLVALLDGVSMSRHAHPDALSAVTNSEVSLCISICIRQYLITVKKHSRLVSSYNTR